MTAPTFRLSIRLGSEKMRSGDDVQRALALVGAELANKFDGLDLPEWVDGRIERDGIVVGEYHIETTE